MLRSTSTFLPAAPTTESLTSTGTREFTGATVGTSSNVMRALGWVALGRTANDGTPAVATSRGTVAPTRTVAEEASLMPSTTVKRLERSRSTSTTSRSPAWLSATTETSGRLWRDDISEGSSTANPATTNAATRRSDHVTGVTLARWHRATRHAAGRTGGRRRR